MSATENAGVRGGFSKSNLLKIVLPVGFLIIAWLLLFSRHGLQRLQQPTLTPQESQRLSDLSNSLYSAGHYQDALEPTMTLYHAYPGNHIYIGRLAQIYDHLGRYDEESKYWERYLDHAPTPIEGCPMIGQSYWKQGDKFEQQAIAAYQRCLALDPQNTDSIFYLAHALEMSGQWPQAAELYQKGMALAPDYTDLTLGLARCWVRMDKEDDAKKLVQKVLQKNPDKADALLALGMIYLHQEKYTDAKKVLEHGAQLANTDPDFPALLARVAEDTNDDAEALRQYTRLAELRPSDTHAQSRRDTLRAELNGKK